MFIRHYVPADPPLFEREPLSERDCYPGEQGGRKKKNLQVITHISHKNSTIDVFMQVPL